MSYLSYQFTVSPPEPGSEILMALISEYEFDSFDFNDSGFTAYIKEESATNVELSNFDFEDFKFTCEIKKIPLTNWNAEWEKNFEPVLVDDLLSIRAPFHEKNNKVKHEIVIMPKMSFGTGHHQTTRLVCRAMFETYFNNKRVLDMGCGTGILAILAMQLGATDILAIDIDEWSVENSIENCATNNCSKIVVTKGDIESLENEKPFDMIIANINKNILKKHLEFYAKKLASTGKLFLSGFFVTDMDELKSVAAKHNLKFVSYKNENEWAMMLFEKE
ncbi:MAG: 50S ribosomal protein L11 methyltransferase [Bacteroidota bacterium]|nr:50S ribosomal protein L11 methyltransferase [Bacteroidota bacterium]MDP3146225.1 50S ribosomal protein L11 methyltransferase [Bacteroidota bacterium]MDP3558148.1 50S ribosomal protein L11 methyltransferase [Bacteroidota bacterium]